MLRKSYLGEVELEVISSKEISRDVEITSRRVEKGFTISDTARKNPYTIDIEVIDNSDEYENNRELLRKMASGEITTFTFSNGEIHENMVIESLQEMYLSEQSKRGMTYRIRLRQILVGEKAEEVYKISPELKVATGTQNKMTTQTEATEQEKVEAKKSALYALIG